MIKETSCSCSMKAVYRLG